MWPETQRHFGGEAARAEGGPWSVCYLRLCNLARDLSRKPTQRAPPHNPLRHGFCSLTSSHVSCVSCNLFLGKSPITATHLPSRRRSRERSQQSPRDPCVRMGEPVPHRKQERAAYPALSTHEPGQAEALSDHRPLCSCRRRGGVQDGRVSCFVLSGERRERPAVSKLSGPFLGVK